MSKIALFLIAMTALGQAPPAATTGPDTSLALIRFQVAPKKGQPVTDLRLEDIEIREDGAPQKVAFFQGGSVHPRTIPIEISLLFDCSRTSLSAGSLSPRIFHDGLLDEFPNVSIAVYGFAGGLSRLAARTRDQAGLRKAMDSPLYVHPLSTFLMDHISRVEVDAASSPGRAIRMLVIFSSGQSDEGSSSSTAEEDRYQRTVDIAQQTEITLYPVMLLDAFGAQTTTASTSSMRGPQIGASDSALTTLRTMGDFANLASATGGKKIEVLSGGNVLPTALRWIAEQIRYEYVAGYEPSISAQKNKHKAEVVMRNKDRGRINGGTRTLVY